MAKKLTNFLIALNDSVKLRDRYRDTEKRERLLKQWDLESHPALQPTSTFDDLKDAVAEESGTNQVDLWIRAAESGLQTEQNEQYDADQ